MKKFMVEVKKQNESDIISSETVEEGELYSHLQHIPGNKYNPFGIFAEELNNLAQVAAVACNHLITIDFHFDIFTITIKHEK